MENKQVTDVAAVSANTAAKAGLKDRPKKLFSLRKKKEEAQTRRGKVFRKSGKFTSKKIILLAVIVLLITGGGYGIYKLFFYEEPVEIVTGTTKKDSITTVIEGTAVTSPTSFQRLTIPVAGTVKEVYVNQGDTVAVGDKLYSIDTTSLEQDIASLESTITDYETQLETYNKNVSNQTITAPFSGKLIDSTSAVEGDTVNAGSPIATLVDDSKMKLSLYFSKAYSGYITKGMNAEVSVPEYMSTLTGTVTRIDNVSYVTAEGTVCFKVTITVDNPGALSDGLTASATITSSSMSMSPADAGTLEYNQTKKISTEVSGTLAMLDVEDSLTVSSGEVLAVISNEDYASQVNNLQKKIESANLNLEELQTELSECTPTATVAGTVIFIRIAAGDEVTAGTSSMAIYNTDSMEIEANINEVQNEYITLNQKVTITKSGASADNTFTGTVTEVSLEATSSNGVAYFPTTITIDSDGKLSAGVYVSYSITAAQASDVVLAPVAALQMTTAGTCLFVQADTKPDNAVDLADGVVPDGYYAVAVKTGLTSNNYVEITSGVSEGVTVFERYVKKNTTSGSDKTSETSDNGAMPSFGGQMPSFGGQMPGGQSGGGPMGGGPMG